MYIYRRSLEIREMKWMAFLLYYLPRILQAELIMLVPPMLLAMIATSLLG